MSLINSVESVYNQISNNNLSHQNLVIRGINDSIATGSLTAGASNNIISYKTNQDNQDIDVVSTSANDSSAGTHARIITIEGIYIDSADSNRFKFKTTTWTMNGTTRVSSPTTGTNGFVAINNMFVNTGGTHKASNHGEIKAQFVSSSSLLNVIHATAGKSHNFSYAVRTGKQLLVKGINLVSLVHTACQFSIYQTDLDTGLRTLIDKIPLNGDENISHQLNVIIPQNHIVFGEITNLEAVVGSNHVSVNMSCVET